MAGDRQPRCRSINGPELETAPARLPRACEAAEVDGELIDRRLTVDGCVHGDAARCRADPRQKCAAVQTIWHRTEPVPPQIGDVVAALRHPCDPSYHCSPHSLPMTGEWGKLRRGTNNAWHVAEHWLAVSQLRSSPFRGYLRYILPNIASTLIVMITLVFPEVILLESSLSFHGARRPAADDEPRQYGRLWPRIFHPRPLDRGGRRPDDHLHYVRRLDLRRLAPRPARSHLAIARLLGLVSAPSRPHCCRQNAASSTARGTTHEPAAGVHGADAVL